MHLLKAEVKQLNINRKSDIVIKLKVSATF